jgi:regulator of sigma E protease
MYSILAIIAFGLMIAIHELGHFAAAKALNVKVNEFAIGMGPKLFSKQGKETLYSLRLLPFGGFCAMEGENDASADERSFSAQKRRRRIVILAAGGVFNLVAAFIIVVFLSFQADAFVGSTITGLFDDHPLEGPHGLMAGDQIISVNGERVFYMNDFSLFMQLAGDENVDLVIRRDGQRVELNNFPLYRREFMRDGEIELRFGLMFEVIEATPMQSLRYALYSTMNYVRIVRISLVQLFSGLVGFDGIAGPVQLVAVMGDIGQQAPTPGAALLGILNLVAFIMVNLAIMNFLPIPALDGGRIVLIVLSWIIEKIIRKPLDPKYEGYINTGALVLLIGLMVFVLFNDVISLIRR